MKKSLALPVGLVLALGLAISTQADPVVLYDADVTENAIFGSGNTNGGYTIVRDGGVELGLRAKVRHNAAGQAVNGWDLPNWSNISDGAGTYTFDAGIAINPQNGLPFVDSILTPWDDSRTGVWSFEWSINSSFDGSGGFLDEYTYELGLDTDASQGVNFSVFFDPINDANPGRLDGSWDHSIGTNATGQAAGVEAGNIGTYDGLIASNNLAQNSWKPVWYMPGFDPTVDGTYNFYLAAFDGGLEVARTEIQVIVGQGGAVVPVPAAAGLGFLGMGLVGFLRRRKNTAA